MREIRPSGSEGGAAQINAPSLPLSACRETRQLRARTRADAHAGIGARDDALEMAFIGVQGLDIFGVAREPRERCEPPVKPRKSLFPVAFSAGRGLLSIAKLGRFIEVSRGKKTGAGETPGFAARKADRENREPRTTPR